MKKIISASIATPQLWYNCNQFKYTFFGFNQLKRIKIYKSEYFKYWHLKYMLYNFLRVSFEIKY